MNHPAAAKRWLVFAKYVLQEYTLSDRERELAILRVGHLCEAEYEWREHSEIAHKLGIECKHIFGVQDRDDLVDPETKIPLTGSETPDIPDADRVIFKAAEELHSETCITDETWARLQALFSTEQIIDLVFTIGQYHLVSMVLNGFGVEFES